MPRESTWPETGNAVAIACSPEGPDAKPDHRAAADAGADRAGYPQPEIRMMPKPKPEDEPDAIDLEQDRGTRPAEPVETDSNDEPAADASGDSDDERPDENQAVPDADHRTA